MYRKHTQDFSDPDLTHVVVGSHCMSDARARKRLLTELVSNHVTPHSDVAPKESDQYIARKDSHSSGVGSLLSTKTQRAAIIVLESWMIECCRAQQRVSVGGYTLDLSKLIGGLWPTC